MRNQVRSLVEGALTTGIFTILLILSIYTPLQILTMLVLPLPFIIYGARYPLKQSLMVGLAGTFLGFLIGGFIGFFYGLTSAFVGTGMGVMYYQKRPAIFAFLTGTVLSVVTLILGLAASVYLFGLNQIATYEEMMSRSIENTVQLMEKLGQPVSEDQIKLLKEQMKLIPKMIPVALVLSSALTTMLNHALARKIARRLRMEISEFPPLSQWRIPRSVLFYYLTVLLLTLIPAFREMEFLAVVLLNARPLLEVLIMVQAIAFIFFLAEQKKWRKNRVTLLLFFSALFLFGVFPYILIFIGLFDLAWDMRAKLR